MSQQTVPLPSHVGHRYVKTPPTKIQRAGQEAEKTEANEEVKEDKEDQKEEGGQE